MRKILWGMVGLALVWSGWWLVTSMGQRSAIDAWLTDRRAEGWQAEAAKIATSGFPVDIHTDLHAVALADPDTGLALRTDKARLTSRVWQPTRRQVMLDEGPITFATPIGTSTLEMQSGVMTLDLHPGTALELERLSWVAGPWVLRDTQGTQAKAQDLRLEMIQHEGAAYDFTATANGFAPGHAARSGLRLPEGFPDAFDSLALRAQVTFDRPWDRSALGDSRPQPRAIALHLAEARWGDLRLNMAADLTVDANGTPNGSVALQAENWQTMLGMAEASGVLPSALRGQAESILGALARASGNESTLDVDLTLRGGGIFLGFIPLGPAPTLVLR